MHSAAIFAALMASGLVAARPSPAQNGWPWLGDWHGNADDASDAWHPDWHPSDDGDHKASDGLNLASNIVNSVGDALGKGAKYPDNDDDDDDDNHYDWRHEDDDDDNDEHPWGWGDNGHHWKRQQQWGQQSSWSQQSPYGGNQWQADGSRGGYPYGNGNGGNGGGYPGGSSQPLCPGLPGVPQCCEVNLLGLVATSCGPGECSACFLD